MRHTLYILILNTLFLAACTSGEEETDMPQTTELTIPFAVCEAPDAHSDNMTTRSTGDPGVLENLPAPRYLYIWLVEDTKILCQITESTIDPTDWKRKLTEGQDSWEYTLRFEMTSDKPVQNGATVQVYAIAAQNELAGLGQDAITTLDALKGLTLNLSAWPTGTSSAREHSTALGNLYSTPLALMGSGNADAAAAGITSGRPQLLRNGTYTVSKTGNAIKLQGSPTRLYHCAAKADFKWEVPTALQPTVSVSTINVTDLPTQLRVFEPTHNPTGGTAQCLLLANATANPAPVNALTDGNKWLGREYAYVLQPPTTTATTDGILHYGVTFAVHTDVTGQTSPATNPVFTTWYRINANIKQ